MKILFWTNKKFIYLIFINKLSWLISSQNNVWKYCTKRRHEQVYVDTLQYNMYYKIFSEIALLFWFICHVNFDYHFLQRWLGGRIVCIYVLTIQQILIIFSLFVHRNDCWCVSFLYFHIIFSCHSMFISL